MERLVDVRDGDVVVCQRPFREPRADEEPGIRVEREAFRETDRPAGRIDGLFVEVSRVERVALVAELIRPDRSGVDTAVGEVLTAESP